MVSRLSVGGTALESTAGAAWDFTGGALDSTAGTGSGSSPTARSLSELKPRFKAPKALIELERRL